MRRVQRNVGALSRFFDFSPAIESDDGSAACIRDFDKLLQLASRARPLFHHLPEQAARLVDGDSLTGKVGANVVDLGYAVKHVA